LLPIFQPSCHFLLNEFWAFLQSFYLILPGFLTSLLSARFLLSWNYDILLSSLIMSWVTCSSFFLSLVLIRNWLIFLWDRLHLLL
jgi:UPF0716 family protein affecting phage T7 exclusion